MRDGYWDAGAAADYLSLSRGAVLEKARRRRLPSIRLGRRVLFSRSALDDYLATLAVSVASPEPGDDALLDKLERAASGVDPARLQAYLGR
jgi:excisionase family DNA binding protein